MKSGTRNLLRTLSIVGLLLLVAGLGVWRLGTASGQQATVSVSGAPASVSAGGANFDVQISVASVTNLGAYEWWLSFDPNVVAFVSATNGDFMGSTGRTVSCEGPFLPPALDLQPGNVRYGCASVALSPPGPNGGGLLSRVTFQPVGNGAPNIGVVCAGLGDPNGDDIPIGNVPPCTVAITPTPGPSATPGGPTETPIGPTATPGGATATPAPTATGPTATPTPLPPGYEAVDLAGGCNPVATTYPNATPIGNIAAAVGPAGNLEALWEFGSAGWLGYSPAYPEVSDLTAANFLDVVFICVGGPGSFGRPIV